MVLSLRQTGVSAVSFVTPTFSGASFASAYLAEDVGTGDYTLKIGLGESGGFAQSYAPLRFRQGS